MRVSAIECDARPAAQLVSAAAATAQQPSLRRCMPDMLPAPGHEWITKAPSPYGLSRDRLRLHTAAIWILHVARFGWRALVAISLPPGDSGSTVSGLTSCGKPVLRLKAAIDRLLACGGSRVAARNPYWDRWGVTIADPDGYRLVLSQRSWR